MGLITHGKFSSRCSICSRVLSQRSMAEFTPHNGRHNVAHGASRGFAIPLTPLRPSPAAAGDGEERGEKALLPKARALCYILPLLTGLRLSSDPRLAPWAMFCRCFGAESCCGFQSHNTNSSVCPARNLGAARGSARGSGPAVFGLDL